MRPLSLLSLAIHTVALYTWSRPAVHPDFTGTWVLDTAILGRQTGWTDAERIVVQTDSAISIRQHNVSEMNESADSVFLPVNGLMIAQVGRAGVMNSARWAGDTLVLTTHGEGPRGSWDDVRRWTLTSPSTLRIDQVVRFDGRKMRDEAAVYRRRSRTAGDQ